MVIEAKTGEAASEDAVSTDDSCSPESETEEDPGSSMVKHLFQNNCVSVFDTKLTKDQFEQFVKELSRPEHAATFDSVSIRNCQLSDNRAIRVLECLVKYQNVTFINLSSNAITSRTAAVIAERFSGWPRLNFLNLNANMFDDDGIYAVVKGLRTRFRTNQTTLKNVDLGTSGMTDQGLQQIASLLAENPPVTMLELTATRGISEAGWGRLGRALRHNSRLQSLMLDFCNMGDATLAAFLEGLAGNRALASLDLEGNRLTDRACDLIAKSAAQGALRSVVLDGNGGVADARKDQLETQLAELLN